jgi:hypothetical protein
VTLWRPKIVDVQHDTLDYSTSDAVTWQIGVRYESVTYENEKEENPGPKTEARTAAEVQASRDLGNFNG